MPIKDLINFIQSSRPPSNKIPTPPSFPPNSSMDFTDLSFDGFPPIERPLVPEWLKFEDSISLPHDWELTIEKRLLKVKTPGMKSVEAFACYLPFHFYRDNWGIYLLESGIISVASLLARVSQIGVILDHIKLSQQILIHHEKFHFCSEVACARFEVTREYPLYRHYFFNGQMASLEEALANALSYRKTLRAEPRSVQDAVAQWFSSQGPGYSQFNRFVSLDKFIEGCRSESNGMIKLASHNKIIGPSEFLFDGIDQGYAPVYLVRDISVLGVVKPFPKYLGMRICVHPIDHPPPHIHVEIPPGVEYTKLEWPSLKPSGTQPELLGKKKINFKKYLNKFGKEIHKKVEAVYGRLGQFLG